MKTCAKCKGEFELVEKSLTEMLCLACAFKWYAHRMRFSIADDSNYKENIKTWIKEEKIRESINIWAKK